MKTLSVLSPTSSFSFSEPYLNGSRFGETILFLFLFWIYLTFVIFVLDLLSLVYSLCAWVSLVFLSIKSYYLSKKKKKKIYSCAFLFIKQPYFLLLVFSSFWGELFGGLGEKTPRPHHLFSFLPTQLNIYQKSFPFHFLSKVFHLPYFTYKQTHPKKRLGGGDQRWDRGLVLLWVDQFVLLETPAFFQLHPQRFF